MLKIGMKAKNSAFVLTGSEPMETCYSIVKFSFGIVFGLGMVVSAYLAFLAAFLLPELYELDFSFASTGMTISICTLILVLSLPPGNRHSFHACRE